MKSIEEILIFTKGATSYTKNSDRRAPYDPQMRTGYKITKLQRVDLVITMTKIIQMNQLLLNPMEKDSLYL